MKHTDDELRVEADPSGFIACLRELAQEAREDVPLDHWDRGWNAAFRAITAAAKKYGVTL